MKIRSIIIFLSLLMIYNCTSDKGDKIKEIKNFPKITKLKGELIKDIELISSFGNLMVVDTFLIVQKREESFFNIYNTNNNELLVKIGSEGRGPNEFVRPELLNDAYYDESGMPCFKVYDYTRRRITKVNIINAIRKKGKIYDQEQISKKIKGYLTYFFHYDKNLLVATPEEGARFLIYKKINENVLEIPFLPEVDFKIKESLLDMVYRSAVVVNTDLELIAAAPVGLGEIDFFNFKGDYLKSSVFESRDDLKKTISKSEGDNLDLKAQIVDMVAKADYIYGLNYNNRLSEIGPNSSKKMKNMKIQVFDWKGNAIKEYALDKRYISSIAVDLKNNRFYGYCPNEPKYNIVSYKF